MVSSRSSWVTSRTSSMVRPWPNGMACTCRLWPGLRTERSSLRRAVIASLKIGDEFRFAHEVDDRARRRRARCRGRATARPGRSAIRWPVVAPRMTTPSGRACGGLAEALERLVQLVRAVRPPAAPAGAGRRRRRPSSPRGVRHRRADRTGSAQRISRRKCHAVAQRPGPAPWPPAPPAAATEPDVVQSASADSR